MRIWGELKQGSFYVLEALVQEYPSLVEQKQSHIDICMVQIVCSGEKSK